MYEHRSRPLVPRNVFFGRLGRHATASALLVIASLVVGMVGYAVTEGLGFTDAFLNAAMLLGGMGPITPPVTVAGKWFAGFYALYCGFVVLLAAGMVAAPVLHRLLHAFHLEE